MHYMMNNRILNRIELAARLLKTSNKSFIATYLSFQKDTLERIDSGRPYVLCTYYVPPEITSMIDTEFLYIERVVGLCAGSRDFNDGDTPLLPAKSCSYQKVFLNLIEKQLLPKPAYIVAFQYPCVDAVRVCQFISEKYQIPLLPISIKNMENDLVCVYRQLKKEFGLRQSVQRTVQLSNNAAALKRNIDTLRANWPGIVKSDDCLKIFTVENDFGSQKAVEVLEEMVRCINRSDKKIREGRPKIFWMGLIPLYDNSMLSKLESKLSCTFVFEEMWMFDDGFIRTEDFFRCLADKVKRGLFYDTEARIKRLVQAIYRVKADIVINVSHKNCSFLPHKVGYIKKRFCEHGITMYDFPCEVVKKDDLFNALTPAIERVIVDWRNRHN